MAHPRRLKFLLLSSAILLVIGVLILRMLLGAHRELQRADLAKAEKDLPSQIRHLRRAMAFYFPGNPLVCLAANRLAQIGRSAMSTKNYNLALKTYCELRSAILNLRGPYQPFNDFLPEANHAIAACTVKHPEAAHSLKTIAGKLQFTHRLSHPPQPRVLWVFLGLTGFLLYIAGILLFIRFGMTAEATLISPGFWKFSGLIVLGFSLFCLGMTLA